VLEKLPEEVHSRMNTETNDLNSIGLLEPITVKTECIFECVSQYSPELSFHDETNGDFESIEDCLDRVMSDDVKMFGEEQFSQDSKRVLRNSASKL